MRNAAKQREKKRAQARYLINQFSPKLPCPNCGKPGPHFVPPSIGETGFFSCFVESSIHQGKIKARSSDGYQLGPYYGSE